MFKMTRNEKKMIAFMEPAQRRIAINAMKNAAEAYAVGKVVISAPDFFPNVIKECKERAKLRSQNTRKQRAKQRK